MTALLDNFLYRANADSVVDRWDDVASNLEGVLDDLASVLDNGADHDELVAAVAHYTKQRDQIMQEIDAATHFLADFIERNRP